jgi:hypothetical protein
LITPTKVDAYIDPKSTLVNEDPGMLKIESFAVYSKRFSGYEKLIPYLEFEKFLSLEP